MEFKKVVWKVKAAQYGPDAKVGWVGKAALFQVAWNVIAREDGALPYTTYCFFESFSKMFKGKRFKTEEEALQYCEVAWENIIQKELSI